MIGIMGALDEEIDLVCSGLVNRKTTEKAQIVFHTGFIGETEVTVAKCGVGKVNAAICTQILIDRFNAEKIIFGGVAGSLLPGLRQGSVVISSHTVQFDIDLTAFGRRRGEIADHERLIEADRELLTAATSAFDEMENPDNATAMMVGTIVSGDRFISDPETIKWLQREFGAACTEMEGGSVGYTCKINQIPFIIIRVISDSAGGDAPDQFSSFLSKSSALLTSLITGTIDKLTSPS